MSMQRNSLWYVIDEKPPANEKKKRKTRSPQGTAASSFLRRCKLTAAKEVEDDGICMPRFSGSESDTDSIRDKNITVSKPPANEKKARSPPNGAASAFVRRCKLTEAEEVDGICMPRFSGCESETDRIRKCEKKKRRRRSLRAASSYLIKRQKITKANEEAEEEAEDDRIRMLHLSGCDRIRKLSLPKVNLRFHGTNMVASNSYLYLIGEKNRIGRRATGYHYLDMRKQRPKQLWRWRRSGTFEGVGCSSCGGATVCSDGLIYTTSSIKIHRFHPFMGQDRHRHGEELPLLEQVRGNNIQYRLLGSTEKMLYLYSDGCGPSNTMLSYDLRSNEWRVLLDRNFWGFWSQGVVLNIDNDAYLFSFGTHNPKNYPPFSFKEQEKGEGLPGVYAFNLSTLEWLDQPVAGLPNDRKILPDLQTSGCPKLFLFQVGMHQEEDDDQGGTNEYLKFALVWSTAFRSGYPRGAATELHWSKFILNYTTNTTTKPHFQAKLLSTGVCHLEGTLGYINCTAAILDRGWKSTSSSSYCMTKVVNGLGWHIKHKPRPTVQCATLKKFKNTRDALKSYKLLKSHDSKFVLHPKRHLIRNKLDYLMFPLVVTSFQYSLANYKDGKLTWTDHEAFRIFRDIVKAVKYLFNTKRGSHGDLADGVCITPQNGVYLWNFPKVSVGSFKKDIGDIEDILQDIIGNVRDEAIVFRLNKFLSFLQVCDYETTNLSLHGDYRREDGHFEVGFILNHPIFWDDDQGLLFLSNMYRLSISPGDKLSQHPVFCKEIAKRSLSAWVNMVDGNIVLKAVKELCKYDDISLYAHSCINQYAETAQHLLNNSNYSSNSDVKHFLEKQRKLLPTEVLGVLLTYMPSLLEDMYEALFSVFISSNYKLPDIHPHQVLQERVQNKEILRACFQTQNQVQVKYEQEFG